MATSTKMLCAGNTGKCPAKVRLKLNLQELILSPHDSQVTRKTRKQGRAPVPDAEAAVIMIDTPTRKCMMTMEAVLKDGGSKSFDWYAVLHTFDCRIFGRHCGHLVKKGDHGSSRLLHSYSPDDRSLGTDGAAVPTTRRPTMPSTRSSGGESHGCDLSDRQPKLAASEEQHEHQTDDQDGMHWATTTPTPTCNSTWQWVRLRTKKRWKEEVSSKQSHPNRRLRFYFFKSNFPH